MTFEIPEKYSSEEWEHFRKRFSESILKTTEIAELGKSVGISWPFKGSGETPEKYIRFSFEELQNVPGLISKKKRVHDLMDVLREILAFDDPFSDMMDTFDKKNNEDRIYERALKKLEVPQDYPVNLMCFSSTTKKLLHENGVKTLKELIKFGKQSYKGDNDLQSFLNGLALINEATIKKHLPFRIGQPGLHLPEAIGLLVHGIDEPIRAELLSQADTTKLDTENPDEGTVKNKSLEIPLRVVSVHFNELCSWFGSQTDELRQLCNSSKSLGRYFLPINDPEIERVSVALARIHFGDSKKTKSGVFNKISNLFKG